MKNKILLLLTILCVSVFNTSYVHSASEIWIDADDYPDPNDAIIAIQNAVDNFDTVILEGTFDFGENTIYITRSVTLKGEDERTLDGKPVTAIHSLTRAITIQFTGGVTISDLHIVLSPGSSYRADGIAAFACYSDDPITILDNYIEMQDYRARAACIIMEDFDVPLTISGNYLKVYADRFGWCEAIVLAASYGDYSVQNLHSIEISDNTIENEITDLGFGGRIRIGHSSGTLANVLVEENVFKGISTFGIDVNPYATDVIIRNNDLSQLTTRGAQITIMGSNTICTENILGRVLEPYVDWIPPFPPFYVATGIELMNANFHDPWTPSWYTENNVIANNDYRLTGLKGWIFDETGIVSYGNLVVADYDSVFEYDPWGGMRSGAGCRNNFVDENGRFPLGTGGAKKHVWVVDSELTYDNRVVGLSANEKSTRGIGQRIKTASSRANERP